MLQAGSSILINVVNKQLYHNFEFSSPLDVLIAINSVVATDLECFQFDFLHCAHAVQAIEQISILKLGEDLIPHFNFRDNFQEGKSRTNSVFCQLRGCAIRTLLSQTSQHSHVYTTYLV